MRCPLVNNLLVALSLFINEQSTIYRAVIKRYLIDTLNGYFPCQIWISSDKPSCHSSALFRNELAYATIKNLKFLRITKPYAIFGVEEYSRPRFSITAEFG